jgi:hypothetical protein
MRRPDFHAAEEYSGTPDHIMHCLAPLRACLLRWSFSPARALIQVNRVIQDTRVPAARMTMRQPPSDNDDSHLTPYDNFVYLVTEMEAAVDCYCRHCFGTSSRR